MTRLLQRALALVVIAGACLWRCAQPRAPTPARRRSGGAGGGCQAVPIHDFVARLDWPRAASSNQTEVAANGAH
jgi:hypothetical protein